MNLDPFNAHCDYIHISTYYAFPFLINTVQQNARFDLLMKQINESCAFLCINI